MKILAINGSPKGKFSNTNVMIESFLKGAQIAGAETESIILKEKKINTCTGCFTCWTKTPGKCVFNDDARELVPKYLEADIIIFASPLYCSHITSNLKVFIDRMITRGTPYFEKSEDGEYRHGDKETRKRKAPKYIMMSNAGFPEGNHFQVISNWINRYAKTASGKVLAEIYRGQGPLLTIDDESFSSIIEDYKNNLEKAGIEIVKNEKISDELQFELDKDLLPADTYIKNITKIWDKERGVQ